MNNLIKRLWLKALRSGKYEQGQGTLYEEDKYCCLGVIAQELDLLVPHVTGDRHWAHCLSASGKTSTHTGTLPLSILDEIGLENEMHQQLVQMNDDGSSFETIADFIEEKL